MEQLTPGEITIQVLVAVGLVLFAGLMSGLTLGLLSLQEFDLELIKRSGSEEERRDAERVRSLIQDQHRLLVTLLVCNAASMETLPLVLDDLVSPLMAVVISVTAVLAFGEIIPQAVCKTHGLAVGAATAPLVRFLLVVCAPVAWPIAKLLDRILGHEGGILYKRAQIKAIVDIHAEKHQLSSDEKTVITGAIDMNIKKCNSCMTPLEHVNYLSADSRLDKATVEWILSTGHSRIPVMEPEEKRFLGVLLVKSLIIHQPGSGTPVQDIPLTPLVHVNGDMGLYSLLDIFQMGRSHLAVVYPEGTCVGDPLTEPTNTKVPPVGIITLEDVVEELIQEEIVDETDQYVHAERPRAGSAQETRKRLRLPKGRTAEMLMGHSIRPSFSAPSQVGKSRSGNLKEPLLPPESRADGDAAVAEVVSIKAAVLESKAQQFLQR